MPEVQRILEKSAFSSSFKKKEECREQRFLDLSKPKLSKALWACREPPLKWGNQETIRPVTRGALNANASTRVNDLSTPKKDFLNDHPQNINRSSFVHSVGRSSVILDVSPIAMKGNAGTRVEELSHHKKANATFKEDRVAYVLGCGRHSPIWDISTSAKNAGDRERTNALAQPKTPHREYQEPREVKWPISRSAMNARSSDYLERLAIPRTRSQDSYRDAQWLVGKHARNAKASNRVQELSQPKKLTDKFLSTRSVEWKVPRSALRAYATERLQQLSTPIKRDTMDHVQFDPLAFQVKEKALKGRIPNRIHDLAKPVIRQ